MSFLLLLLLLLLLSPPGESEDEGASVLHQPGLPLPGHGADRLLPHPRPLTPPWGPQNGCDHRSDPQTPLRTHPSDPPDPPGWGQGGDGGSTSQQTLQGGERGVSRGSLPL